MPDDSPVSPSEEGRRKNTSGLWVGLILLVVVGLVSWFGYNSIRSQALVDQTLREQFTWHLVPALPDPANPGPRTTINLQIADVNMPLGTFAGDCVIVDGKDLALLSGELSGVVCRLPAQAGVGETGIEIGIFKEGDELVLKKGDIGAGSERGSGFVPIVKES